MSNPSVVQECYKLKARDGIRNFILLMNGMKRLSDNADLARARLVEYHVRGDRMIELGRHRHLVKGNAA